MKGKPKMSWLQSTKWSGKALIGAVLVGIISIPTIAAAYLSPDIPIPRNTVLEYLKAGHDTLEAADEQLGLLAVTAFEGEWERVVESGFGDLNNEYAWAMSSFTDDLGTEWLYVGTLNQTATLASHTAKVYRSSDGETWEYVRSFPGCSGMRGATKYAGLLWFGTLNPEGTQLWVTDGTAWRQANEDGFGVGARSSRGIREFDGTLYADAGQMKEDEDELNAQIFSYSGPLVAASVGSINPASWISVTPIWENPVNSIGELLEYNGSLYAGTWSNSFVGGAGESNGCEVWRYTPAASPQWERISEPGFGDSKNGSVLSMAVFDNQLYVGTQNFEIPEEGLGSPTDILELADGAEVWRWNGSMWQAVIINGNPANPLDEGATRIDNLYMWRMIVYKGELIVGTMNIFRGGELWASKDGVSFRLINDPGMRRDTTVVPACFEFLGIDFYLELSEQYGIRTVAVFDDMLYVGTASWAYFVDWIIFDQFELGCPDVPTGPFGFYMYSPNAGCEVWRLSTIPEHSFGIGAYPNPFHYSRGEAITIDRLPDDPVVYVYTVAGELVRILRPQWPVEHKLTWDATNEDGERVARGVYVIVAKGSQQTRRGKIAVLK